MSELLDGDGMSAEAFEAGASAVVRKTQMARELPAVMLALFRVTAGGSFAGRQFEWPRG